MKKKSICGNCRHLELRLKKKSLGLCINTPSIFFRLFRYPDDEACEYFENKFLMMMSEIKKEDQ